MGERGGGGGGGVIRELWLGETGSAHGRAAAAAAWLCSCRVCICTEHSVKTTQLVFQATSIAGVIFLLLHFLHLTATLSFLVGQSDNPSFPSSSSQMPPRLPASNSETRNYNRSFSLVLAGRYRSTRIWKTRVPGHVSQFTCICYSPLLRYPARKNEAARQMQIGKTLKNFTAHRYLFSPHLRPTYLPMAPASGICSISECSQPMSSIKSTPRSSCRPAHWCNLQAHRELRYSCVQMVSPLKIAAIMPRQSHVWVNEHRWMQIGLRYTFRRCRKGAHKSCLMGVRNLRDKNQVLERGFRIENRDRSRCKRR